jgi:hypothetical protein
MHLVLLVWLDGELGDEIDKKRTNHATWCYDRGVCIIGLDDIRIHALGLHEKNVWQIMRSTSQVQVQSTQSHAKRPNSRHAENLECS